MQVPNNYSAGCSLHSDVATQGILVGAHTTTMRYAEKFDHPFSHVFIFSNMFPESHGFVSVPVKSSNNFVSFTNLIDMNWNKIFL